MYTGKLASTNLCQLKFKTPLLFQVEVGGVM